MLGYTGWASIGLTLGEKVRRLNFAVGWKSLILNIKSNDQKRKILECVRGESNFVRKGRIFRFAKDDQWRRQLSGTLLTLRNESVGSKLD